MWDGFNVPKNLDLVRDQAALSRLKEHSEAIFARPISSWISSSGAGQLMGVMPPSCR
jgi:hypothetical protein